MKRILVMGASGQIGSELTEELIKRYGSENVFASDIKSSKDLFFEIHSHDCRDKYRTQDLVKRFNIDTLYYLPALLSSAAEKNPQLAWDVNLNGLFQSLEVCREQKCSLFTPSSIGAFGTSTPKLNTPQDTIMKPETIYGVSKVAGELLCDYYFHRFGVDTRGVRYPGVISSKVFPGGGTTDYAVEIYYEAIRNKSYVSPIGSDTFMDMMYMPDAIRAAIEIMEANPDKLKHRNAFNVTAMSFSPEIIGKAIQKYIPDFKLSYDIDPIIQSIADSWPDSLDDSVAREEWNWKANFDLDMMTIDMLTRLKEKLA